MNKLRTLNKTVVHGIQSFRKLLVYNREYAPFLPYQPRHDDLYIVSYPGSGVTWLCTIIANINIIKSGLDHPVTFYNYKKYVPDINTTRHIYDLTTTYPGYRIIKSHSVANPHYKSVIYLVRNPVSVMKAYYEFSQYNANYKGNFVNFIKDNHSGINVWANHVRSWLKEPALDLHLLTFEDLRRDTATELLILFKNIGLNVESEILNKAIELSSLENMKQSESDFKMNNPGYNFNFIREGRLMGEINSEAKKIIRNATLDIYEEILYSKYKKDFTQI